jgi:hypothetical protein
LKSLNRRVKIFRIYCALAGFEVSGIVDELCPTLGLDKECPVKVADRVIVYPANEEEFTETG